MCSCSPQYPQDLFHLFSVLILLSNRIRVATFQWPFIFTRPVGSRITTTGWSSVSCHKMVESIWIWYWIESFTLALLDVTFHENCELSSRSVLTSLRSYYVSSYALLKGTFRFHNWAGKIIWCPRLESSSTTVTYRIPTKPIYMFMEMSLINLFISRSGPSIQNVLFRKFHHFLLPQYIQPVLA